jgi:hypothetical protein
MAYLSFDCHKTQFSEFANMVLGSTSSNMMKLHEIAFRFEWHVLHSSRILQLQSRRRLDGVQYIWSLDFRHLVSGEPSLMWTLYHLLKCAMQKINTQQTC